MTTLTITEAKKNLGKWLTAATKGQEVGIINGAKIVALRPVEVQARSWSDMMPIDYEYLRTEYGMSEKEIRAFEQRMGTEAKRSHPGDKLIEAENLTLEKLEEVINHRRRPHKAARPTAATRPRRRAARAA